MNTFPDDDDLVIRLQNDDIEAFDAIYYKYAGKLYAFGLKYLRSSTESEELVQSIFIRIWENRHKLRGDTSFKSYLFTIAYNDICKYFRKKKYFEGFITETLRNNPDGSYSIDGKLDSQSVLERVQKFIEKLPENQKKVFLKSRLEGKSTKEIAEEVGLSPGTVDNYILEVNRILKRRFASEELCLFFLILPFI